MVQGPDPGVFVLVSRNRPIVRQYAKRPLYIPQPRILPHRVWASALEIPAAANHVYDAERQVRDRRRRRRRQDVHAALLHGG